ncbi:hypothetical protein RvY_00266 [Ramazzottius varieornatus]|uniref:Tc1-like transposase DDE domain-containing protein n=1 Tax=Ramazzottius varieornatus TaxID=947166 RepID=A0A1D1UGB6_RAMVA|nr:hypothetical protein RvY_00266 [Ramazzottius varieornatus]
MAPQRTEHSLAIRNLVIKKHLLKVSNYEISRQLLIPRCSVIKIVKKYKEMGSVENNPRCGRPRKTTALTDRLIVRKAVKERQKSASTIEEEIKAGLSVSVSEETDNDPKHKPMLVSNWLNKYHTKQLFWAPYSPDLNPIEHLWAEVERRLRKIELKNIGQLEEAIVEVWYNIEPEFCRNLVHSMPRRIAKVKKNQGFASGY